MTPSSTPEPTGHSKPDARLLGDRRDRSRDQQTARGRRRRWHLTCDPAGGTHPDPEAACGILADHGELALPPVPKDVACTEIYGGPEKATIFGTCQGQRVLQLVLPGERL